MPATRFAAENSAISVDATAVPMAPESCCTVFITAEPSAFIAAGSWFSACVWSGTSTNPDAAMNSA